MSEQNHNADRGRLIVTGADHPGIVAGVSGVPTSTAQASSRSTGHAVP
jgi:hypothetical protein